MQHTKTQKQRKGRWPAKADYIRVSVPVAKRLIEHDVRINGLDSLLAHGYFANANFFRGIDSMDNMDLILAIKVGIERNAVMEADDPKHAEKTALRKKQVALFGDLEQSIALHVGYVATFITPNIPKH